MNLKYEIQVRAAILLFYKRTQRTSSYVELLNELELLNQYLYEFAGKKNNRPNKTMVAFSQYYQKEKHNERNYQEVVKRATGRATKYKKSYKDYTSELLLLHNRGYSLRRISSYAKQHFKISVSKDTLSKYFKKLQSEKRI